MLETRMLHKRGAGDDSWTYTAYIWNDEGSDASKNVDGADNVAGTEHDVPDTEGCASCHDPMAGKVLGFSAIQLAHNDGDVTLAALNDEGLLSDEVGPALALPGDPVVQGTLGYLHGNCGNCHNRNNTSEDWLLLDLWTGVDELGAPEDTALYRTAIGAGTNLEGDALPDWTDVDTLVAPGDPDASLLFLRSNRREKGQMPPLASERVDPDGVDQLRAWIESL